MKKVFALVTFLAFLMAVAVGASPSTVGNVLRLHRQAPSSFPDASVFNTSGLLGDNDGGVYISNGTTWSPICTSATGCGETSGPFDAGVTPISTAYFNNVFDAGTSVGGFYFSRESIVASINYYIRTSGTNPADAGTFANLNIFNGTSSCNCPISCAAVAPGAYVGTCTGTCTFTGAANYSMTTECGTSPSVYGNATLEGVYTGASSQTYFFQFAPSSRAGIGPTDCACADVTDATGTIPMTMARSTTALCVPASGYFVECPVNKPRIQNGAYFMEDSATNNTVRSDEIADSAWLKVGGGGGSVPVATANYGLAPDGTMTAGRLQGSACPAINSYSVALEFTSTQVGTNTESFYVKGTSSSGVIGTYVNNASLVTGASNACAYNSTTWVRCSVTAPYDFTEVGMGCIHNATTSGASDTGAYDVLVWRVQAERGPFATSGIKTTVTGVLRDQDTRLTGVFTSALPIGNFCVAASVQRGNTGHPGLSPYVILTDNTETLEDVLAQVDSETQITLTSGASPVSAVVPVIALTQHRLVWSNLAGTPTITWDLANVSPKPTSGTTQVNAKIKIGAYTTNTSNVIVDVAGCQ